MPTRLYFHASSSSISGTLPGTDQSVLSSDVNGDSQTVNRSMSSTVGSSQTQISVAAPVPTGFNINVTYYMTRFVSPLLNQTSIASGTWTYTFATSADNGTNNFPVTSGPKAVRVNCYVWKPSNGTRYGTIKDGTTATTISESLPSTNEYYHITTFSGSAISSITAADAVIILEIWFQVTTDVNPSGSNYFYYDGTTVSANDAVTSSAASYLETPQTLSFIENQFIQKAVPTQTVAVSESVTKTVTRQLRQRVLSETTPIIDSIYSHASPQPRHIQLSLFEIVMINDGNTVGHSLTRAIPLHKQCSPYTESIDISDYTEAKFTSGTIIYTGDPEYRMT